MPPAQPSARARGNKNNVDTEFSAWVARIALFFLCLCQAPLMTISEGEISPYHEKNTTLRQLSALEIVAIGIPSEDINKCKNALTAMLLPGQIFKHGFAATGHCLLAQFDDKSRSICEAAVPTIVPSSQQEVERILGPEVKDDWTKSVKDKDTYLLALSGLIVIGSFFSLFTTWILLALFFTALGFFILLGYPDLQIMPGLLLCGILSFMAVPDGLKKLAKKALTKP